MKGSGLGRAEDTGAGDFPAAKSAGDFADLLRGFGRGRCLGVDMSGSGSDGGFASRSSSSSGSFWLVTLAARLVGRGLGLGAWAGSSSCGASSATGSSSSVVTTSALLRAFFEVFLPLSPVAVGMGVRHSHF